MNQPIENYIKPGIVHFMIFPQTIKGEGPILETIWKITNDDYFKVIEISWIKDETIRKQAKAMLDASGIEVKYGAQPRLLTQQLSVLLVMPTCHLKTRTRTTCCKQLNSSCAVGDLVEQCGLKLIRTFRLTC